MEYRVLGRLSVQRDGTAVEAGAFKQASLLAYLLMQANTVVSTDQILEALWGEEEASERQNTLWVYISNLRGALDPDREKRSEGTVLLTRSPGYVLQVDDDQVDARRFERLLAEGRSLAESDPAAASLVLAEALSMWSGRPYEDFTYEPFAQTEINRLEALRLEAVEARIDADLRRGLTRELVSELETLVRQHPLHEAFTAQLMLALYRSGRQAQALRAFQLLRSRLGDELGIEPSARLRDLEEKIVIGDESLAAPVASGRDGTAQPGLAVRGYELRDKIGEGAYGVVYRAYQPAVGREVAVKIIRPELANSPTFIRRFEAEAQLVASLEHPRIVPLYDYWREPNAAYLVMRYMRGGGLDEVIERSSLDSGDGVKLAGQVAEALTAAHANGVVHRDVKPSNVLLDGDGNAYLSDFGIAMSSVTTGRVDQAIDQATLAAPYASPEQEERATLTSSSDLYSLAVVVAQALAGSGGSVADVSDQLPPELASVLDRATQRQAINRFASVAEFAAALAAAAGSAEDQLDASGGPTRNPYKGLMAFGRSDAEDFFGREDLIMRLLDRLGGAGVRSRFIALVGPSGSGKSSVVRAGLLPALAHGRIPMSEEWFIVEMTPDVDPHSGLADALISISTEEIDPSASVADQVRAALPDDGSQLVLVIDQFEELFTHTEDENQERFLSELATLIKTDSSRTKVVATMRADFYDRPLSNHEFGDLLRHGTELITPMSPDELDRAIRGPADAEGIPLDTALVGALIGDVGDRSGALPLLQYALTELVEAHEAGSIGLDNYEGLGRLTGALTQRADAVWSELSEGAKVAARHVFLNLVTLGEGTEDTRRRVLLSELRRLSHNPSDVQDVIDRYAAHRMLTLDLDPITRGPTVEISHEALLRQWERLRTMVSDARFDIRQQRDLSRAAQEWKGSLRQDEFLLSPGRLARIEEWLPLSTIAIGELESEFVEASAKKRDEAAEREQRLQRQSKNRLRGIAAALGAAAIIGGSLSVYSLDQRSQAVNSAAEAEASASAAEDARTDAEAERDIATELRDEAEQRAAEVQAAHRRSIAVSLPDRAQRIRSDDPELALLLAGEAVVLAAETGVPINRALAAMQLTLQDIGVTFGERQSHDVVEDLGRLEAVFLTSVDEVLSYADTYITRDLTEEECRAFLESDCPSGSVADRLSAALLESEPFERTSSIPALLRVGLELAYLPAGTYLLGDFVDHDAEWYLRFRAVRTGTGIDLDVVHVGFAIPGSIVDTSTQLIPPGTVDAFASPYVSDWNTAWFDPIPLNDIVRSRALEQYAPPTMREALIRDGDIIGVWTGYDAMSSVWYRQDVLDGYGLEPPDSWNQMVQLVEDLAAAGETPWCYGTLGANAQMSPVMLLQAAIFDLGGVAMYDEWVAGELDPLDPRVVAAHRAVGQLFFDPRYSGDPANVAVRGDRDLSRLFDDDPGCVMAIAPVQWFADSLWETPQGDEIGVFSLPANGTDTISPVAVQGTFISLSRDTPASRQLPRYVTSSDYGRDMAWTGFELDIPANMRIPGSLFINENSGTLADAVNRAAREDLLRLDLRSRDFALHDAYKELIDDWYALGPDGDPSDLLLAIAELRREDG